MAGVWFQNPPDGIDPSRFRHLWFEARTEHGLATWTLEFKNRGVILAACQIAVSRPDLLREVPATFDEALALARAGRVAVPLKPIDALSCFLTLCANQGEEPLREPGQR